MLSKADKRQVKKEIKENIRLIKEAKDWIRCHPSSWIVSHYEERIQKLETRNRELRSAV